MFQRDNLELAILEELAQVGTCTIEELYQRLPYYSRGQVFSVLDRLTRQGIIIIKNPAPSRSVPLRPAPSRSVPLRPLARTAPRESAEGRCVMPV
jgi:hypothetical protein